jgi:glycosyltransferase involved in cell wall biosynthesis
MAKSKTYEVVLFQPYIRRFVLNFDRHLKRFKFRHIAHPPELGIGYHTLPTYENEIRRNKNTWRVRLRRLIGIPNVRFRFDNEGDMYFTYGSLVLGRKPYCTYIETGVALYNYDMGIARNPLAQLVVMFATTRSNCKKLIFLSEAGRKSFFATVWYPPFIRRILEQKSIVIYPVPIEKQHIQPRKYSGTLKLFFPGTFYIKGGLEIVRAYERLRQKYPNIELTVVTALHVVQQRDIDHMRSLPGLTLMDAKLTEREMIELYQTHDIFLLPTYREGFGLVLIEALAYGLPVIITDQYATAEMAVEGYNGFVYKNHPLLDYDPETYKMRGRYSNPRDFYAKYLELEAENKMKPIEDFLVRSITKFCAKPELLEEFSRHSLDLYASKFDADMLGEKLESVFLEAVSDQSA